MIYVQNYNPIHLIGIVNLFHECVHSISDQFYDKFQKFAWAPAPINYKKWELRFLRTKPFVATLDENLVGFVEFDLKGFIDCFYINTKYQKKGLGKQLYWYVEKVAKENSLNEIFVHLSKNSISFFEKLGFCVISKRYNKRNNAILINYEMKKYL